MNFPRYAPGSHFESCPAATGETRESEYPCGTYPDSAHRCRKERDDVHHRHACLCGYEWISLSATALNDPQVQAIMHPPRHAR